MLGYKTKYQALPGILFVPSIIEKNWGWRAKSKNAKKMFLLGTRALRAAAGRSVSFVQKRFGFGQTNAPKFLFFKQENL